MILYGWKVFMHLTPGDIASRVNKFFLSKDSCYQCSSIAGESSGNTTNSGVDNHKTKRVGYLKTACLIVQGQILPVILYGWKGFMCQNPSDTVTSMLKF